MRFSLRCCCLSGERHKGLCAHFASLICMSAECLDGSNRTSRVHITLCVLHKAANADLCTNAVNKALPTNWIRPHWMRLLLSGDAFCAFTPCGTTRMWLALLAENASTTTPSRRAVLYAVLLMAFFSHPQLSFRGGVI